MGQPFRPMGFVSVIIVSLIFALGLPLVLLFPTLFVAWRESHTMTCLRRTT